ncbi:fimbrillin family protein [Parabacteroides sp. PFB2-10]|uniref:fimbrillin family protein n=1 Tax=Parabacteroides sp. PFB2-10 TaxID=1742405 RepID=UPI0024741F20|nr:fimbrillin family protein [Parabacteroides sp. PFB2-10]MDL2245295.1 fimbrillin family protein [Parabacteroides sp. OttesenSCG-928-J18]
MNRNIYIGLFLFATLLWGCDKEQAEEPTPPDNSRKIGLYVDADLTKAEVTTTADQILSLGIIGYSTGTDDFNGKTAPNLFDNALAERMVVNEETGELSSWSYTPIAYWPANPAIKNTFFAYSPHQENFPKGSFAVVPEKIKELEEEDTISYPYLIYSVPENMSEQIDLLYSEYNADVQNINYEKNNGSVKYNMKHALLWLRFMIAPLVENDDPLPNEVERYEVTEFNMTAGRIINTGRFDMATATWTNIPELNDDEGYEPADYAFDYLWEDPLMVDAGALEPMGGRDYANCLMIIPQNIELSKNFTAVNVAFIHHDASDSPSNTEHYITMPFPDVKLNKPGYVMTFIVKLSISGAWIEFQSSNPIDEWLEDETLREIEGF